MKLVFTLAADAAALLVLLTACDHRPSAPTGVTAPAASAASTASSPSALGAAPSAAPAAALVIGDNADLAEDTDYAIRGTTLRLRIDHGQRATVVVGGHVWGARVTVTDGAERRELELAGPDRGGEAWHGYRFELTFVVPTSLRITRE